MADNKKTGTNNSNSNDEGLPRHAVINFDVARDASGNLVKDSDAHIEFHANMGPGNQALLLYGIQSTAKKNGGATIYKAKVIDLQKAARDPGTNSGDNSNSSNDELPATTLFYIHGFNNNVTGVFENCRKYQEAYPNRVMVPVLWADHQTGLCGYVPDRLERVDPAGQAISDFVNIVNHWAFPRRSLVCHSMGNYVLQKLARFVQQTDEVALDFDDIFMVAADASAHVFDSTQNPNPNGDSDGLAIIQLAKHQVHVLYSHWDWALKARRIPNCGEVALGAIGYDESKVLVDEEARGKLVQINCSKKSRHDWIGHNYQFEDWAMTLYEESMNSAGPGGAPATMAEAATPP